MPHRHKGVGAFVALEWIAPDQEGLVGGIGLEERIAAGFADRHVTVVATGVGDRVTDLTGKFLAVNLVHRVVVATGSGCRMTIHALRRFHACDNDWLRRFPCRWLYRAVLRLRDT